MPATFNASASNDPDGSIASYDWAFGDGQTMANGGPSPTHVYSAPGTYQATLTLTDNEGCSTSLLFTGQTAYCNGAPTGEPRPRPSRSPTPAFSLKCPKSARPGGCKFKLQAIAKKPKKGKSGSEEAEGRERPRQGKAKAGARRSSR